MKVIPVLLCFFSVIAGYASPKVFLNYYVFYTDSQQPYVETALQFSSGSLKFVGDSSGNLQAKVEITQIFKQGERVVVADKYLLKSPLMKDSVVDDFFDMKRFSLKPGQYQFELIVKDLKTLETVSGNYEIKVNKQLRDRVEISDIEFVQNVSKTNVIDNFSKNGYQLIPYFSNYFPPSYDKLAYYLEFYNVSAALDSNDYLVATFQIQDQSSEKYLEPFFQYKKLRKRQVIPVINILPIEELPSGTYNLVIDVVNKQNDTLVHKSVPIKRRSDHVFERAIVDVNDIDKSFAKEIENDSIIYFLSSIVPISQQHEIEKIMRMLEEKDTTYIRQYFYSFWKETNPVEPLRGWKDYKLQVSYAEKLFGTQIKRGFESDRGRIHLKYGPPNYVTDQPNGTSAYPYQIWHYYRIGERSNVRFVFYNPDLVTNDYPLIHSDLPGEVQNQNWQQEILKRNNSPENFNQSIRGNSGIFFED